MAPSEIDFYKILGLGRHATDDDIKRSFRKLARDTHPDKNPNDPTAKERFQDLQHAYDTLKDNLERSKYDEDNPYHGLDHPPAQSTYRPPNGTPTTKSGTAKRYTAGSSAHTPGWANGTPRGGASYNGGFAQQAAGPTASKPWRDPYAAWESAAKTHSGFAYQTGGSGYRPSSQPHPPHPPHSHPPPPPHPHPPPPHSHPPPRPPPPAAEYRDESYAGYGTKPKREGRESAYARTNADRERAHPTAAKYGSHGSSASSSSPRPKSTSGTVPSARYAGASTDSDATPAGFNVADYIRAATEQEKRRKLEEQKLEREQRLRREAEEQLKRQDQQRKQEEQHQRRHEAARERERRRAEEAARNPYPETNGFGFGGRSTPTPPRGYSYGFPPDASSPYTPTEKEEDLLKEADEKMRAKAGKQQPHPHPHPHLSSGSRRRSKSSMKPKPEASPSAKYSPMFGGQGIPENASGDRAARPDIDVVEATPTDRSSSRDYFSKFPNDGPGYIREDGTGVYPAPPFAFKMPAREKDRDKSTPTKSRADRPPNMPGSFEPAGDSPNPPPPSSTKKPPKSPRHHSSGEKAAPESTSDRDDRSKSSFNVFEFQETSPNPKVENVENPIFSKPDFLFVGPNARVGSFTSNNSPEPQVEKASSSGSSAYLRPPTQPPFVPSPSAPPNMQQQQAAESANKANGNVNVNGDNGNGNGDGDGDGEPKKEFFKRELYDNLLKQANPFKPQAASTSATGSTARRKRSAPTLKKKQSLPIHRMASLGLGGSKEPKLNGRSKAESDVEGGEPRTVVHPLAGSGSNFGYEPMDAEPTGPPRSVPAPTNPSPPVPPVGSSSPKSKGPSPLSNMNGMRSVPPLSRSPADVGLGEFELKDPLPFPSRAPTKKSPPFATRLNKLRSKAPSTAHDPFIFPIPADFWDGYPQTPLNQPFVAPKPPPVPKIPRQTSLDVYNRFYNSLGSYIEAWNKYEAEVHALRAELTSKSMHVSTSQTLDTQDIVKYMDRVKNKDTVLDNAFTKARDRHIAALDSWVKLRETVLGLREQH